MTPVYIHMVNRWSNAKEKNISVDSRIIAIVRLNWSPYEEEQKHIKKNAEIEKGKIFGFLVY